MKKNAKNPVRITIEHENKSDVDPGAASGEFINRLASLLGELQSGERVLKHGLIALTTNTLERDLPADLDPKQRTALVQGPRAGTEEVFAAGPQDDLMQLVSKLPEHLSESLIAEHQEECDNDPDDCLLHDPTVAPYIGTLRAMSMVFARISAEGNTAATKFLHRSLKEMGRAAVRLSERQEAMVKLVALAPDGLEAIENNGDSGMFAVSGEKAAKFMQALVGTGILPPELEDKIRDQMAAGPDAELELPEDKTDGTHTIIRNGSNTKH